MNKDDSFSRRRFMAGAVAATGGVLMASVGQAQTKKITPMNIEALKKACKGVVATPSDANFKELLHGNLWNKLIDDRSPDALVRVNDVDDVIAAINFARESGLKVVVRGGGHNWCQPTLRHGGLLIDITNLNKVISIDPAARRAVLQPIISNRDSQKALNAVGMAYPSGHCPQVKLSGYLLGGGMAWNQGVWGHGTESVESMKVVTSEGKLITASETENPDYFWAARGSASGFFGVVVEYTLKLYPLPKAIHASTYFYSIDDAQAVGNWLSENAPRISPAVELTLFLLEAPAARKDLGAKSKGKICMVTCTAFSDTPEEAKSILGIFEECPVKSTASEVATPMTFEQLFDASGSLWPEFLRNRVEATFSNSPAGDIAKTAVPFVLDTPSPITLVLYAIFTGPNVPPPQQNMAFSMNAKVYGGPWTMWKDAADDEANSKWHAELCEAVRPFNVGYYIGETDSVIRPATAVQAFLPANWQKLADLRDKYDPDGLFFGYFDGFRAKKA